MLWALILLSLGGLALGPLLVAVGRVHRVASAAIDGFTIGAVPLLVIVRLMPHAYDEIGLSALLWAGLGFGLVAFAHRGGHALETRVGQAVVFPTLALHALADGTALALSASAKDRAAGTMLAIAIVMHRLPEGLFVASTSVPVLGWRRTILRLALLGAATVAGAALGVKLLEVMPERIFEAIVAFGLGAMLRIVIHQHDAPSGEPDRASRAASGIAFVVGVGIALGAPAPRSVLSRAQAFELSIAQSLVPLFVEVAPALLVGLALALVLHRLSAGVASSGGVVRGLCYALVRPLDAARPAPMVRALFLSSDAPFVIAFALALPVMGIEAVLLSLRLVGVQTTMLRLAAGALISLLAGVLVARVTKRGASFAAFGVGAFGPATNHARVEHAGGLALVVGLVLAAVIEAAISPLHVPAVLAVICAAMVGGASGVPALTAIPLAAVMVHKGLPVGAAVAFLVAAPASDAALHAAIGEACGPRASLLARAMVIAVAIAVGFVAVSPASVPAIHPLVAHAHHLYERVAALLLFAVLLLSVVRRGARGWLWGDAHPHHHEEHAV